MCTHINISQSFEYGNKLGLVWSMVFTIFNVVDFVVSKVTSLV